MVFPSAVLVQLEALTPARFCASLGKMSSFSAYGLHCSEVSSIKALPNFCLHRLCADLSLIEFARRWPEVLAFGYFIKP